MTDGTSLIREFSDTALLHVGGDVVRFLRRQARLSSTHTTGVPPDLEAHIVTRCKAVGGKVVSGLRAAVASSTPVDAIKASSIVTNVLALVSLAGADLLNLSDIPGLFDLLTTHRELIRGLCGGGHRWIRCHVCAAFVTSHGQHHAEVHCPSCRVALPFQEHVSPFLAAAEALVVASRLASFDPGNCHLCLRLSERSRAATTEQRHCALFCQGQLRPMI
jgi:hypothetical protein